MSAQEERESRLDAARTFTAAGLVVIPFTAPRPGSKRLGKIPVADDEGKRIECTSTDELTPLLQLNPYLNIAVLGLAQIDPDNDAATELMRDLGVTSSGAVWIVRSSRGFRALYRPPSRPGLLNVLKNGEPKGDIELDLLIHSPALVPPSVHPSGRRYLWAPGHSPADIPFSELEEPPVLVQEHWENRCRRPVATGPLPPLRQPAGFREALEYQLAGRTKKGVLPPENAEGWINEISCPFIENHRRGDSNPSFGVNFRYGAYNCFSVCGSGPLIELAERLGIEVPHVWRQGRGRRAAFIPSSRQEG